MVAHDLRTPITGIKAIISTIQDEVKDRKEVMRYL